MNHDTEATKVTSSLATVYAVPSGEMTVLNMLRGNIHLGTIHLKIPYKTTVQMNYVGILHKTVEHFS